MKELLAKAINAQNLTQQEAEQAIGALMSGEVSPAMTAAFLVALRMKGETVDEITGAARAMRAHSVKVPVHHNGRPLFDTAGTGGDGAHTFNLSTAAAFVIAGTGRKVAKHGNRAASSRSGSADVLAALGVNLEQSADQVGRAIDQVGIGFMFAPKFHPAMKHVGPVRQELGQRTIFNLLGPLTNPAGADVQIIGVYAAALTEPLARVLHQLGTQAAMVVHGHGGTDELNLAGPAQVSHLQGGHVRTYTLDPVEFGFTPAPIESLRGGTPEENAGLMRAVLDGSASLALRDAVLFNAAAAIAAETDDLAPAIAEARASLESGAANRKLSDLIAFSKGG